MRYLIYFKESNSEISIEDKIESIISMYNYICDKDMTDSLNNYVGDCCLLFLYNLKFNRINSRKKPYILDGDGLANRLRTTEYKLEEKLELLDKLYKLSKIKRFEKTKEEIEEIFKPIFDIEIFGSKIISNYEIEQYFNGWRQKACFLIKISIDETFMSMDKIEFEEKKSKMEKGLLKEFQNEFYKLKNLIKRIILNLNLGDHGIRNIEYDDNTHLSDYYHFRIRMEEM